MLNKKACFLFTCFLLMCEVEARNYVGSYGDDNTKKKESGFDGTIPFDKSKLSIPYSVKRARYELNLNEDVVIEQKRKYLEERSILDGTKFIDVVQKPSIRILKTIDTIYVHPSYLTTIIFPKSFKIIKPRASFNIKVFEYDSNVLRVQPAVNSSNGNIALTLSDGKSNKAVTLFVKRYIETRISKEKREELIKKNLLKYYKQKFDYLETVIKYNIGGDRIDNFKIIEEYLTLHQIKHLRISNNLDYVTFSKRGVTYYIIRDDEFGTIFKDGLSLKIKKSL